jgi:hypothetical protein
MMPPKSQGNDNHSPESLCELRIDEMKRRLVARIACAARGMQPLSADSDQLPDRSVRR